VTALQTKELKIDYNKESYKGSLESSLRNQLLERRVEGQSKIIDILFGLIDESILK